jgi:hypothetical protein
MTPAQISRINAAFETGLFDILAGDYVTYVSPTGVQYSNLLCLVYDVTVETHRHGLKVDVAGIRDQGILEILFSKARLAAAGVTVDTAGHWLIGGVRYDFAVKEEVLSHTNPVGGMHNLLTVRVRQSAELNQTHDKATDGTTTWGFDLT